MSNTPKKPFFQRTWVMVVALLIFAPLGILLLWKNCPKLRPGVKIGISAICALVWIGALISGGTASQPSRNVPQNEISNEEIDPGQNTELPGRTTPTSDPGPTPEPAPEPTPEPAPEPSPEPTPEPSPEPTPEPEPEPDSPSYKYVGSTDSDKFHYPDCRFAKEINPENLIGWDTVEAAKAAGYEACGVCHPR